MNFKTVRPKVGLLITALLEDDWNKAGYLRPAAQAAVSHYVDALTPFADVVCPGLVETEEQAAAADLAFKQARVDAIVFTEMAYTQSMVTLRGLARAEAPIIVWNTQMLPGGRPTRIGTWSWSTPGWPVCPRQPTP